MKQTVLHISKKFDTVDKYILKTKNNGVHTTKYNLKYKELDGLSDHLINKPAAKAIDTGNEVIVSIEGDKFELNYSQVVLMRLLLEALAQDEDPTYKDLIY